jgi:hypothetical protein
LTLIWLPSKPNWSNNKRPWPERLKRRRRPVAAQVVSHYHRNCLASTLVMNPIHANALLR